MTGVATAKAAVANWMLISGVFAVMAMPAAADEGTWPAKVSASYALSFNGFVVGRYQFQSQFTGKTYSVTSTANVSALFGAFKWNGNIAANGLLDAAKPHPSAYNLNYKGKSKVVSVSLGFDKDAINKISLIPNKKPSSEALPVREQDLRNVFDPLSAILALTHSAADQACNRSIPIFDGKNRFDLVLSYKGEQKVVDKKPSGQPAKLVVCTVKYKPVSGHKPKDFESPWVDYDHMEIAFRPVPAANSVVPYRLSIPTTLGSAVMSAEQINITAANNLQIALTQ